MTPAFRPDADDRAARWDDLARYLAVHERLPETSLDITADVPGFEDAPPAVRAWASLTAAIADSAASHLLRDPPTFARVPGHPATSIMVQAEGDLYWAIRDVDRAQADPPVWGYVEDYESGGYVDGGQITGSVSSFAVDYFAVFAWRPMLIGLDTDPKWAARLKADALHCVDWDGVTIAEFQDCIAVLSRDWFGVDRQSLKVLCSTATAREALPAIVREIQDHAAKRSRVVRRRAKRRRFLQRWGLLP